MQIVKVVWTDSASSDGWQDEEHGKEHTPSQCMTVGWLLKKTRGHVTLAGSRSDFGNCSQLMAIPRKCIVSIKTLEE